jgi:signal transduction histidine kinase
MRTERGSQSVSSHAAVAAVCGLLTILLGSLVLLGWAIHSVFLVQVTSALPPMQRNTAVGLAMSGVALVGIVMSRRRLTFIASGVTAVLALATLLEYLLRSSFGIDELLGAGYIVVHTSNPGRMSPTTSLCLLALATVFALSQTGKLVRRPALLGVTGLLIAAVGATCALSILTGRDDAFAWGDMTRIAFSTAAALLMLGTGSACVAWSRVDFAAGEPAWVPIGAGLFLATLRAGMWQAFSFRSQMNFVSDLTLVGVVFSAIVFGIFIHLLLKAHLQRGALLAVNLKLETEMVERRRAEEEAHAANRAKGQFLAHMSHEIRTPINGVLGMTELVLDTDLTVDQRELLETARSSAGALVTIVNDILDFSKIEAGRLDLNPVSFRVRDVVSRIVKLLACQAEKKGVELCCDIRPEVPEEIQADPTRLSQVITNLVGNAVKFTNAGEIELRVGVDSFEGDGALLHVSVRDTGIGVPQEKQSSIFEPFIQADGSTTRRFGGTGLGLTVSRRLVDMMGGRIWVESEPGQGSCFHFTCRARVVRAEAASVPAASRLAGLPVLVVDDNATNRRILAGLLDSVGIRRRGSGDDREGSRAAKTVQPHHTGPLHAGNGRLHADGADP